MKKSVAVEYLFYKKQPVIMLKRKAPNFQPARQMGADAGARGVYISHGLSCLNKEKEVIALANAVATISPLLLEEIIENHVCGMDSAKPVSMW